MSVGTSTLSAAAGKAGVATASLFMSAAIFNDPAYIWMSVAGAVMSVGSLLYSVYKEKEVTLAKHQIFVLSLKAFMLGLVSMPALFLTLSEGIVSKILNIDLDNMSTSACLVLSFAGSWYFVSAVDKIFKDRL